MPAQSLATVTQELIEAYANTARHVIQACRAGSVRMGEMIDARWVSALARSASQLTHEVRDNAQAAHDKISAVYHRGIAATSDGAENVIDRMATLATTGVTQVAANAERFEAKTGVAALTLIAGAALPAAQATTRLATEIERRTGELAGSIAANPVERKVRAAAQSARTQAKKAVRKAGARVRKAA